MYLDTIPCQGAKCTQPSQLASSENLPSCGSAGILLVDAWTHTWKKSNVRPMFPNTAGSSEQRATGTPLFSKIGNGCMGIDDVNLCG